MTEARSRMERKHGGRGRRRAGLFGGLADALASFSERRSHKKDLAAQASVAESQASEERALVVFDALEEAHVFDEAGLAEREPALPEDEAPEPARRSRESAQAPDELGWRASRRTSRRGRTVRKTYRREQTVKAVKGATEDAAMAGGRAVWGALAWTTRLVLGVLAALLVLMLLALAINGIARWSAERRVGTDEDPARATEDNILVVGLSDADEVVGFLALRAEEEQDRVFGIAIPDAAFMEVPGQGFERAGDSYKDGPDVSASMVSNFLSVSFEKYAVVSEGSYQQALQEQSLSALLDAIVDTNMDDDDVDRFRSTFASVSGDSVALVPLPVKPIALRDETYFEPQRDEIADLLLSWWGVEFGNDKDRIRVIVYNGSGVPGIAGTAAQELISQGFRVVETRNAEHFEYEKTLVVLYHGETVDAERVRDALGVGEIVIQDASQQIADVIVIVGADFAPADQDG